jgi:hypothetical protein
MAATLNQANYGTGVYGTAKYGQYEVTLDNGVEARSNQDLGGATHAEYFVPSDTDNPNLTVIAYEDSTTVYADGVSQGTITSAGGTLTITAANYEDKIISANKPITLQNANNETVGVPTSWAGTSFGVRNTRTGVNLQMRALYGTASVEIFKDGVSTTTLSVGSTATTTQFYADDTSDPEYTIYSDIPIMVFKSGNTNLSTDSRSLFPATTDFIYGIASGGANAVRVDGYGETAVSTTRHDSNGGSNTSRTISTVDTALFATDTDFTGPTNRISAEKAIIAFSIADSDGGEKTTFVPAGCFANEFRLIEAAEFVCFMGEPGTNGRYIKVYNSSGTLVDTVQLATSNTGSDYPTKFQLISSTTTDPHLTGNAKGYALTAGMRFVSEVPVGAIVEDDSSDNENNLFGLRYFGGLVSVADAASLTGVIATGAVGTLTVSNDSKIVPTGVEATGAIQTVAVTGFEIDVSEVLESVSATGAVGTVAISNTATLSGVSATASVGTVEAKPTEAITGVSATGSVGTVAIGNSVTLSGVSATGAVGTLEEKPTEALTGVSATGSVGTVAISNTVGLIGVSAAVSIGTAQENVTEILTGVVGTTALGNISIDSVASATGVSATGTIGTLEVKVAEVVTGVDATGAAGTVTVTNDSKTVLTGVEATGAIEAPTAGGFEIDITEIVSTGVSATGAVNAVQVNTGAGLTGVEATGAVNDSFTFSNTVTLTAVVGTGAAGAAQPNWQIDVVGVSSTARTSEGRQNVTETPTGVAGTGAAGDVNPNVAAGLTGVEATGQVGSLNGGVDEEIDSVAATGAVGAITVNVVDFLAGTAGTSALGTVTTTAVVFDFDAIKEQYGRKRVVYVEKFTDSAKERRVYVPHEERTVVVGKAASPERTVRIPQESRTVYIDRFSTAAERRAKAA